MRYQDKQNEVFELCTFGAVAAIVAGGYHALFNPDIALRALGAIAAGVGATYLYITSRGSKTNVDGFKEPLYSNDELPETDRELLIGDKI